MERLDRLADDLAHSHARIQRGIGILENNLQVTTLGTHRRVREMSEILAAEQNLARRRLRKAQDRTAQG